MDTHFAKHFFLIGVILSCTVSCGDRKEDKSLSVNAYIELGMPDPAKKWEIADYIRAYNALAKIKWETPLQLPVKDSDNSGLLFEHLVSLEYLSFLKDTAMTLSEKAGRISEFSKVYNYWMDIYTNPVLKENYYDREIIDIQIFNLNVTEAMVNLAHEINKSDDPADIALQYGYAPIKESYLAALNTDLKTQSYTNAFDDQDLERMADSIYNSAMRNKEWMDSNAVNRLKHSLRIVMDSTSSDYIRSKYETLEKSLTKI
jgi:hypothetical protein